MKLVREHINEKFEEDSDPIEDLGIGKRAQIKKWFESIGVKPDEYTINKKLHIIVYGPLNLYNNTDINITELPDNLTVKGSLDLRNTKINRLPNNLKVTGNLDLEGTSIIELPDNLTVGGSLLLRGTGITKLPDNLTVKHYIYKDF